MKKFWKEFFLRGSMVAWIGPLVLSIVWGCLQLAGQVDALEVGTVVLGIISAILVAFIAGGLTALYQMEQLPLGFAILIHMAALYLDYLIIYLINDWLNTGAIWVFTVWFVAGFALVWLIIFLVNRRAVNRMNATLGGAEDEYISKGV